MGTFPKVQPLEAGLSLSILALKEERLSLFFIKRGGTLGNVP
jgi:hypothetical protein